MFKRKREIEILENEAFRTILVILDDYRTIQLSSEHNRILENIQKYSNKIHRILLEAKTRRLTPLEIYSRMDRIARLQNRIQELLLLVCKALQPMLKKEAILKEIRYNPVTHTIDVTFNIRIQIS